MCYRLIGIDLDGTLLDPNKQLTTHTRAAIARAVATGVLVVPATSRAWHMAHHLALQHLTGLRCGVFLDGATVCDIRTGQVNQSQCIEPATLRLLAEAMVDAPVAWDVCRLTPDGRDYDYAIFGAGPITEVLAEWDRTRIGRHRLSRDTALNGRPCLVTWLRSHTSSALDQAERLIAKDALPFRTIRWTSTASEQARGRHVLQLHAPTVDKWTALCEIARDHDIPREQIATIGDEINDVTMIRESGCGVAMGNAIDAVKAVADRVAPANTDNGVAYAIEQLLAGRW